MEAGRVLEPFQLSSPHKWEDYAERFEFYATARGITDAAKKRATFLSCCGPETFELAKALLAPVKLQDASLRDIIAKMTSHLAPTATKMSRRVDFYKRQQQAGEPAATFLAELRKLAQHCGFSNLEESLRDRFVCGLSSSKARRRIIIAKEEVTLASALQEAIATEATEKEESADVIKPAKAPLNTTHFTGDPVASPDQSPVQGVELVRQSTTASKNHRPACAGCGGNHDRKNCRFRDVTCRACGRLGHLARVCRSATSDSAVSPRSSHRRSASSTHLVDDCNYLTVINGKTVPFPAQEKTTIRVQIEGHPCDMEVDSGSGFSMVSDRTARSFFPGGKFPSLETFPVTLQSYTAGRISILGMCSVKVLKKFHDYVYGRPFTIQTDHKPLLGLFVPHKQTPQMLSPRMLRWSIFLNGYQYELCHVKGTHLCHADALSRLPLPHISDRDPAPAECVMMLEALPGPPVKAPEIATRTMRDPVLARVLAWVGRGWPEGPQPECFRAFKTRQHELSLHRGCLLWGDRVIIPEPLRNRVLGTLHMGHPGMVRMKSLARCYVWWPGMDQDIEKWVRTCTSCQEVRPDVPRAPVHWWEQARTPWSRLHIDFAGPHQGKVFLVVVDAYSKWLEVAVVPSMTSAAVIRVLRQLFATHGLPETIVSDNGMAFVSQEFKAFLADNFIRGATSAPFHPSSNGQAERMVRTAKEAIARLLEGDWAARIARMLFLQHATPCTVTGKSPAELLMGRRLVTIMDFVHPDKNPSRPARAQPEPERDTTRYLTPEELVWVRNYARGPAWVPGVVTRASGPVSYFVTLDDGRVMRRHIDQLRRRAPNSTQSDGNSADLEETLPDTESLQPPTQASSSDLEMPPPEGSSIPASSEMLPPARDVSPPPILPATPPSPQVPVQQTPATPVPRRPQRNRRPPNYLRDFECFAH
nr:uncharacterized protein LOC118083738 [Zootoca vivipara]